MSTLRAAVVAGVGFMVLDGAWLGWLMKDFYRREIGPIMRMADGGMAPNWPAAFLVYVALATGIAVFVVQRSSDVWSAAGYGALYGALVYGVYDFTNYSILSQWTVTLTVADVCWGAFATAVCSALARALA